MFLPSYLLEGSPTTVCRLRLVPYFLWRPHATVRLNLVAGRLMLDFLRRSRPQNDCVKGYAQCVLGSFISFLYIITLTLPTGQLLINKKEFVPATTVSHFSHATISAASCMDSSGSCTFVYHFLVPTRTPWSHLFPSSHEAAISLRIKGTPGLNSAWRTSGVGGPPVTPRFWFGGWDQNLGTQP
jgi:hypothetical protein